MINPKALQAVAALTLLVFLPSCAGVAQQNAVASMRKAGKSEAEIAKFQKDQQTTTAQGAGAGAILGGIAGALIGGNVRGALIGAGAGLLSGAAVGQSVANQKAGNVAEKFDLLSYIKRAEARNVAASKKVTTLQSKLAKIEAEIKRAKAEGDTKALGQQKTKLKEIQQEAQQERDAVNTEVTYQRSAKAQAKGNARYGDYTTNMSRLEGSNAELKKIGDRAASLSATVGGG